MNCGCCLADAREIAIACALMHHIQGRKGVTVCLSKPLRAQLS